MGSNLLLVFAAFLLVLLNGFFVAAEFGLVKLRQTHVQAMAKTHGRRGRLLVKVHQDLDAYLSACQLGITLSSLGLGWIGEPAFSRLLEPLLQAAGIDSPQLVHGISFVVAFFTISYLHIVVGELAPKSLAIRMSEKVGLWTAPPLYVFYWAMYPAIWLLNHSAGKVLSLLKLDGNTGHDSHYSADELKLILRSSRADGQFTGDEWRVLAQSLDFRKLEVSDLMRPFNEAVCLRAEDDFQTSLDRAAQHRFSRYPYLDDNGHVQGIIHLKDVLFAMQKHDDVDLGELLRPALRVSPHLSAMELFRRLQQGAPHFAIVEDSDDGQPLGYLTLDNLLGAMVGEIRDEFRQARNEWARLDDGSLLGKGSLPIFTLERALGVDIEPDQGEEVDTVGGLIFSRLGNVPSEGERIRFEHFDAVVKKMHGPRIVLLRIYPHDE